VIARVRTYALQGVAAREVTVEVDVRPGLPAFSVVGLPDASIRESRERVRAALSNSGFEFPQQRIIASLAPADLRKAGPAFDLAIAAGVLRASDQLNDVDLDSWALAGELGLDGSLRSVPGTLAMAEAASGAGITQLAVAAPSAPEAALAVGLNVVPIKTLGEIQTLGTPDEPPPAAPLSLNDALAGPEAPDLADLRGQAVLRRALEIAAAGGHGLMVIGPPGAGKSMAARRLPSLLPPLSRPEALEVARIASACGRPASLGRGRPFRAPHHTISAAGLVGGGNPPRPGEVTLAHRGVLFLDELGEFHRDALEALRQPLEEGRVVIARSRHVIELPCRFQLIAAANPCPCGRGSDSARCGCGPGRVRRYAGRLSGALADRVDISLRVEQPSAEALHGEPGESSAAVRDRVLAARERQEHRFGAGACNAEMSAERVRPACRLDAAAASLLTAGHARLGLSGRGFERVLRVARTIADLDASERVGERHIGEALSLRRRSGEAAGEGETE
jgi:magnesium chelatase family protein